MVPVTPSFLGSPNLSIETPGGPSGPEDCPPREEASLGSFLSAGGGSGPGWGGAGRGCPVPSPLLAVWSLNLCWAPPGPPHLHALQRMGTRLGLGTDPTSPAQVCPAMEPGPWPPASPGEGTEVPESASSGPWGG